jgi:hypothetical protein
MILLPLLITGQSGAQESGEQILTRFMEAIVNANAMTVLELLDDTSRAEATQAADSLHGILLDMTPQELGGFFSGLGLEAAPDEVVYWQTADFLEILLLSVEFDSSFAEPEESGNVWKVNCKNGIFLHIIGTLEIPAH